MKFSLFINNFIIIIIIIIIYLEYYEWWYEYMKPDEHYIPVKKDLSDLIEKLEWAKENDEKARQIAENGSREAAKHLFAETVFCYYLEALDTYRFVAES